MAYGIGTRSDNRSPEHNAMKRDRAEFTKRYEAGEIKFDPAEILLCHCRSFRFPHEPKEHSQGPRKLLGDWDWRKWEERIAMKLYDERIR